MLFCEYQLLTISKAPMLACSVQEWCALVERFMFQYEQIGLPFLKVSRN